jgi:hypothetical protein
MNVTMGMGVMVLHDQPNQKMAVNDCGVNSDTIDHSQVKERDDHAVTVAANVSSTAVCTVMGIDKDDSQSVTESRGANLRGSGSSRVGAGSFDRVSHEIPHTGTGRPSRAGILPTPSIRRSRSLPLSLHDALHSPPLILAESVVRFTDSDSAASSPAVEFDSDSDATEVPGFLARLPQIVLRDIFFFLRDDLVALLSIAGTSRTLHATVFHDNRWLWRSIDFSRVAYTTAKHLTDAAISSILSACDPDGSVVRVLSLHGCSSLRGDGLISFLSRSTAIESLDLRLGPTHRTTVGPTGLADPPALHRALIAAMDHTTAFFDIKLRRQRAPEYGSTDPHDLLSCFDWPYDDLLMRAARQSVAFVLQPQRSAHDTVRTHCVGCDTEVLEVREVLCEDGECTSHSVPVVVFPRRATLAPFCSLCDRTSCNVDSTVHTSPESACPIIYDCIHCDSTFCSDCRDGAVCETCMGSYCSACRPSAVCMECESTSCELCLSECASCGWTACNDGCFDGAYLRCGGVYLCADCEELPSCDVCNNVVCLDCDLTFTCDDCETMFCEECFEGTVCAHCNRTSCGDCDSGWVCESCGQELCLSCAEESSVYM